MNKYFKIILPSLTFLFCSQIQAVRLHLQVFDDAGRKAMELDLYKLTDKGKEVLIRPFFDLNGLMDESIENRKHPNDITITKYFTEKDFPFLKEYQPIYMIPDKKLGHKKGLSFFEKKGI